MVNFILASGTNPLLICNTLFFITFLRNLEASLPILDVKQSSLLDPCCSPNNIKFTISFNIPELKRLLQIISLYKISIIDEQMAVETDFRLNTSFKKLHSFSIMAKYIGRVEVFDQFQFFLLFFVQSDSFFSHASTSSSS